MNARRLTVTNPFSRRMFSAGLVSLCAFTTGLLTSAPAMAAAPEAPSAVEVQPVTEATRAFVQGRLNPGKEGEPGTFEAGTYEFLYRESKTTCEGGGHAPVSPGMSLGGGREPVQEVIEGLNPDTEYAVCLLARNEAGTETSVGPAARFRTAIPPETPETGAPTAVAGASATLQGVLNPHSKAEAGSYQFIYKISESECENGESLTPEPPGIASGQEREVVTAEATGLQPGAMYTFCLVAFNGAGEREVGAPEHFTALAAAPTVSDETFSKVAATSAVVGAQIDPDGLPTAYRVEYVTDAQFKSQAWSGATLVPSTEAQLPEAGAPVPVRVELAGLEPETKYDFRFSATNSAGAVSGIGAIVETLAAATDQSLPDGRAYELVSSASEPGEVYVPTIPGSAPPRQIEQSFTELPFRAAANGSALAYVGDPGAVGGNGSSGKGLGNEYLAGRGVRSGPNGWEVSDINPAAGEGETAREAQLTTYEFFSEDLSMGFLSSPAQPLAMTADPSGPPNCWVMYSHSSSDDRFHALFSSTETPGSCGGREGAESLEQFRFAGASADSSQTLFQTPAALVGGATVTIGRGNNLYDSRSGTLRLVNVLPDGELDANATFGGPAAETSNPPDFSSAISADGSRVFWSDAITGAVYVRENPFGTQGECPVVADACTLAVSTGPAKFWTASHDGRYAIYSDSEGLWRFDVQTGMREQLADGAAAVQGVIGTSEDGAYVYFVAAGALESEPNMRKEVSAGRECAEAGGEEEHGRLPIGVGCNLYVWHVGQPLRFIATLAAKDNNLKQANTTRGQRYGDWRPDLGSRTAELAPDGTHLVFASTQQLTDYDNSELGPEKEGLGGLEVFAYNAATEHLSCASCDPSGAPPDAAIDGSLGTGGGTYLPVSSHATFMRRWMSTDGSEVFFNSSQPLVPYDTNSVQDVYEWEAEGTHSCPPKEPARLDGGCVFLLSGGESYDFSYFVDAGANGSDVFIAHRGPLGSVGPRDDKVHIYDARVGGGFLYGSLACTGTGCQGTPPAAPLFATPSSVTFSGLGNFPRSRPPAASRPKNATRTRAEKLAKALKACRTDRTKRRRVACEARARKRFGPLHKSKKVGKSMKPGNKRRVKS
ncbi:MAG TPA: hypothetical protein VGG98_07660 [Solirubrobacteraceae bacterium]|jgi:hypothetical protein